MFFTSRSVFDLSVTLATAGPPSARRLRASRDTPFFASQSRVSRMTRVSPCASRTAADVPPSESRRSRFSTSRLDATASPTASALMKRAFQLWLEEASSFSFASFACLKPAAAPLAAAGRLLGLSCDGRMWRIRPSKNLPSSAAIARTA